MDSLYSLSGTWKTRFCGLSDAPEVLVSQYFHRNLTLYCNFGSMVIVKFRAISLAFTFHLPIVRSPRTTLLRSQVGDDHTIIEWPVFSSLYKKIWPTLSSSSYRGIRWIGWIS